MEETDVLSALESLSCRRRAEGQTAFPDWPTITEEIEIFARRRRIAEHRASELAEREGWEKHRIEHPEEYVTTAEVWAEVSERLAKKAGAA